jgi:hypothetical protein
LLDTTVLKPARNLLDAEVSRQLFTPKKRSLSYSDLQSLNEDDDEQQKLLESTKALDNFYATKQRSTFWNTLTEEIVGPYESQDFKELAGKREAVYNFVRVPFRLERVSGFVALLMDLVTIFWLLFVL